MGPSWVRIPPPPPKDPGPPTPCPGYPGVDVHDNLRPQGKGGQRYPRDIGGTIPADDIPELKKLGVAEVFTPGASTDEVVEFVRGKARRLS